MIHNKELTLQSIIGHYADRGSDAINGHLRSRDRDKTAVHESHSKLLCSALDTCPKYSNRIIYRKENTVRGKKFVFNWFNQNLNKIIEFPAFMSCSQERHRVDGDASTIMYEIATLDDTNAFNINYAGGKNCELEVLIKPNSCFKIIGVFDEGIKVLVKLQEIKEKPDYVIFENAHFQKLKRARSSQGSNILSLSDLGLL